MIPCDNIDVELCSFHPHNEQPCEGNCGDMYLRLTIKDWRGDVMKSEGRLDSLRGGIMLDEEGKKKILEIYEKLKAIEEKNAG